MGMIWWEDKINHRCLSSPPIQRQGAHHQYFLWGWRPSTTFCVNVLRQQGSFSSAFKHTLIRSHAHSLAQTRSPMLCWLVTVIFLFIPDFCHVFLSVSARWEQGKRNYCAGIVCNTRVQKLSLLFRMEVICGSLTKMSIYTFKKY